MPKRILIVEDDADIRGALSQLLRFEGYEVFESTNGREGLDCLERFHGLPDLILLDLMMPIMNGWDFLKELRSQARYSALPVFVLSAVELKSGLDGVQHYFKKPINFGDFIRELDEIAGGRATQAEVHLG